MSPSPARRSSVLLAWLAFFLLGGSAVFIGYQNLIEHVYPVFNQLPTALSSALGTLLGLVFLCLVRVTQVGRTGQVRGRLPQYWLGGAAFAFAVCLGMIWGIDPHGHFGSLWFQPMVLSARGQKLQAYTALARPPELVVMGSSNVFTISPSYLDDQLDLRTYNFGVEASQIEDALLEARYLYRLNPEVPPKVLLVEVGEPLSGGELTAAKRASVTQWPMMGLTTLYLTLEQQARETFNNQSLADATFVLLYYFQHKLPPLDWEFQADGQGIYTPGYNVTDEIVTNTVRSDVRGLAPAECPALDPVGQGKLHQLIALAEGQGTSVVFYRGPVHPDYYQAVLAHNPGFETCHALLVEFLRDMEQEYPRVFFVDLLQPPEITALGTQAFYDSHHLSPAGARVLVDILSPVLSKAAGQGIGQP